MKKSISSLMVIVLLMLSSGPAAADCTGLPDLDRSIIQQAYPGVATLLVVPDGSGPPVTAARTVDGAVVDATIHLTIISFCEVEQPVANFPREDMWLESLGGGLAACIGGSIADDNTDVTGHTRWSLPLLAGGYDEGNCRVLVNGTALGDPGGLTLNFNSPDMNGDGEVNLTDVYQFSVDYYGPFEFRADFLRDGAVNLSDVAVLAASLGTACP